jgi:drug/metabolite transporter (DMT)-like permease
MRISKALLADLALVLVTAVWGSTFVLVKTSLVQASPILFIALRFWIATAVTLAVSPGVIRQIPLRSVARGALLSVFLAGAFVFQTLGLLTTSPSRSAFLTSLSVLFVPLFGLAIFKHRPKAQTSAGVLMAVFGLYFLLLPSTDLKFHSGDLLTLVCALVFALHILFLGRFAPQADARQLIFLQMSGSALLCTAMIPVVESPFFVWNTRLAGSLLATGVLATALAFHVQTRAQQFTTANHVALIFSLEPFFAVFFAYLMMGETLTGRELLGGMLVLLGILVSEVKGPSSVGQLPE